METSEEDPGLALEEDWISEIPHRIGHSTCLAKAKGVFDHGPIYGCGGV